ncbi:hypothetical protein [Streptomyces acidiscabies]
MVITTVTPRACGAVSLSCVDGSPTNSTDGSCGSARAIFPRHCLPSGS